MKPSTAEPGHKLHFTALTGVAALLSVLLVGTLAVAPARSHYTDWRRIQSRYNALAARAHSPAVAVGIKQLWVPSIDVVDRCPSCHLSVETAPPLAGDRLFSAHPDIPHDARRIGCTPCHGGEGRATSRREAHGEFRFRTEPLLARSDIEAGCGTCHSHIPTPARALVAAGQRIFDEVRCRDCHTGARDLHDVGLRGFSPDWHDRHVGRSEHGVSFGPLADEEIPQVTAYLMTLVGAPRLMAARMLAAESGCRGCHRIAGVGGELGPDLTSEGRRSLEGLDFTAVRGPHTLPNWLRAHFIDPQSVSAGSAMPILGFSAEEAGLLTTFALSLRAVQIPLEHSPPDRIRGLALGQRDFATDGASLYGAFCVGCHGRGAEGAKVPTFGTRVIPLSNPDYLLVAEDRFLRTSIARGRPGRLMPGWDTAGTGLRAGEIDALVRFLRGFMPAAPTQEAILAEPVDAVLGERLFSENCVGCHGPHGEGSMIAPPLGALDNLTTRNDTPIVGTLLNGVNDTAMRSFRRLDAASLRGLVATVRALPPSATPRTGWARRTGNAARGRALFDANCAMCHGPRGEGGHGPALNNPGFLASATDEHITASIVRGFAGTEMPSFGRGDAMMRRLLPTEVADVVAFVRAWAPATQTAPAARTTR